MYDYDFDHYTTFCADSTIDLAEQIMEYEDDLDYQIEPISIAKTITKL
jgi:hypothetical protein